MAAVLASSGGSWCGAGSLSSFFSPSPQPLSQGERGCSAGEAAAAGVSASLFCARRAALRAAARAFAASMAAVLASSGGSWCGAGAVSVVVSMLALKAGTLPPPQPSPAAGADAPCRGGSCSLGASPFWASRSARRAAARAFAASMVAVLSSVDDSAARFADEPHPCPSSMGGGGKSAGVTVAVLPGV